MTDRYQRSGSFSNSSLSYQPLNEAIDSESDQYSSSASRTAPSSSSQPQPFHIPPYNPSTSNQPPPPNPRYTSAEDAPPHSLSPSTDPSQSSSSKSITISFRTLSGQVMTITFPSLDSISVLDVKRKLEDVHGIPVSFQRLIFSGREMSVDNELVASYGMEDGSMVHLLLRQNSAPAGSPHSEPVVSDAEGMGLFNGIQIPIAPPGEGEVSEAEAERLVQSVRLSRAIKFLALISVLGLLLLVSKQPEFMIGALPALAGYYGAHSFNARLLLVLYLYIACSIAFRIYFMVVQTSAEYYVVMSFLMLLDLYLARLVGMLYSLTYRLTISERHELMILSRPPFGY